MKKTTLRVLMIALIFVILACAIALGACYTDVSIKTEDLILVLNSDGNSYGVIGLVNSKKSEVVIPSHYNDLPITVIYSRAFNSCGDLTSITIPNTIEKIEYDAFNQCVGLSGVYIDDLIKWFNIDFDDTIEANPLYYAHRLYLNNEPITDLVIPESVTEIKSRAFSGASITSVTFHENVDTIGYSSFEQCNELETVYWNVTSFSADNTESVFRGCPKLTTVVIGENVEKIESAIFDYSPNENVRIDNLAKWCNIELSKSGYYNPLPLSGRNLYVGDELVTNLSIPNSVNEVAPYAFAGCKSIQSVTIPNSVTLIGSSAFAYCPNLSSADLNCSTIGSYAFSNCGKLSDVVFRDNLLEIGYSAFSECSSIETVIIPDSVKTLESDAFSRINLKKVVIGCGVKSVPSNGRVFSYCGVETLSIPAWLLNESGIGISYVDTLIVSAGESITDVGSLVTMSTHKIYIADTVKTISADVFYQGFISEHGTHTIYCQAVSQPDDWEYGWNKLKLYFQGEERKYTYWNVVWGCDSIPEESTDSFVN